MEDLKLKVFFVGFVPSFRGGMTAFAAVLSEAGDVPPIPAGGNEPAPFLDRGLAVGDDLAL